MARSPDVSLTVLTPGESESWEAFFRRLSKTPGDVLVVVSPLLHRDILEKADLQAQFLTECRKHSVRLRLATRDRDLGQAARLRGIRVLDAPEHITALVPEGQQRSDVLRLFAPHVWQTQLASKLQRMGLLSIPRVRIALLVTVSIVLLGFIIFRLLPSAEIRVWPRQEPISQTTNIFLVLSGAQIDTTHVRTMPLIPVVVTVTNTLAYDQVSKEFLGTSASVPMTVINTTGETYAFRAGTRLMNQAGMVFRITEGVSVPAGGEKTVLAESEEKDLFGNIIGDRGNVPAGVRWEFIGLSIEERKAVYAENRAAATGGATSYRTILTKGDLEKGKELLQQQLLATARKRSEEDRQLYNVDHPDEQLEILRPQHSELSIIQFSDFHAPEELLGESVTSVPIEGTVTYTAFAYDAKQILALLSTELREHVREGKQLIESSLSLDHLDVRVIGYADDFSWIKLTIDLLATDRYILDPLSPPGALFAKTVRERVVDSTIDEAKRILKNMPEVERVEVHLWPPWSRKLPEIPANIVLTPQ